MQNAITAFFKEPLEKILCVLGTGFYLLAFCEISVVDKVWDFKLVRSPNWFLLFIGTAFLVFVAWRNRPPRIGSISMNSVKDGFQLRLAPGHIISVIAGQIEDAKSSEHAAVVLPANTAFDDQCIRDKRSALGAFFLTHFPEGIAEIQSSIRKAVSSACDKEEEHFEKAPPGTTILIDRPLGSPYRIIVTAVTALDDATGIKADTLSLIASVKQVFRIASRNRFSFLTMPVMGTGHGGLDFKSALSLILVQCIHCMQHEGAHHVRNVTVVVYDPEKQRRSLMATVIRSVESITRS